jgi:dTDP-4-dehydrorhamnose 3,5-epimerase
MRVQQTIFHDCFIITPDIYRDYRGEYIELYNEKRFAELAKDIKFVEDDISVSYKNVLKGFHGDTKTWKLIQCLYGRFQLAIIDNNKDSSTFQRTLSLTLDDKARQQVLAPAGFGNAHLCLSDMCIFHYKQSALYTGSENQFTLSWKLFNNWAIDNPILSERDRTA